MSWISMLFSNSGTKMVDSIVGGLDDLFTSDHELALTDVQKTKIKAATEIKLKEIMAGMDAQQAKHEENTEAQLTKRLKLDMKSDSWLSKNIRPLALIFLTVVVSILAFFTVFDKSLNQNQLSALQQWIPFFSTLMLTTYGFYYGSRGIEKIQSIRAANHGNQKL